VREFGKEKKREAYWPCASSLNLLRMMADNQVDSYFLTNNEDSEGFNLSSSRSEWCSREGCIY